MILLTLAAALTSSTPIDLDVFFSSDVTRPTLDPPASAFVAHVEPRLGVPSFVWAVQVGPDAPPWTRAELTPAQAARRHLLAFAPLYRVSGEAIGRLDHRHTLDLGHGAVVVTFGRSVDGVPLFRDELHVVMTQQRELIAVSGLVNPGEPKEHGARGFRLTAQTAVELAMRDLELSTGMTTLSPARDGWEQVADGAGLLRAGRARRVWYGLPEAALEPAWHVELDTGDLAFFVVVSAWDGRLLSRKNLEDDATWRVFAQTSPPFAPDDSPYGVALTPHPTGARSPAIEGPWISASLVTTNALPGARQDPWLPAGATTLEGNNAFAFADLFSPSGFNSDAGLPDGGARPQDQLTPTTAPDTFDYLYDPDAGPTAGSQANAASTHLFFTVNWVHDWLLAAGFDEAAGNGQRDNLGRGGKANDRLEVSSLSFARPNNASMTTLADGERSRMQMGNFAVSAVRYLDLGAIDGGRTRVTVSPQGPSTFSITAPVAVMQSDAGPNGCEALFDPAALAGRIAVSIERGTCLAESFERARDGGAVALVVLPPSGFFPTISSPDASFSMPVVGVSAQAALLPALDAGSGFSASLVGHLPPSRPSALDTQVIVHEFGHFLSNRLIADTAGLQLQISRSMGEGWSDFLALLQTVRAADATQPANGSWSGGYAMGAFVNGGLSELGTTQEHHWYGIRRVPYSTDFEKNGLSFRHIRDGAALPAGAIRAQPNSQVHAAGEVWCTMLWEGFVAHLRASADVERARTQMLEALVASLKATPANPDFLEARDALLAVAFAADPAFFRTLYGGFARRGAGPRAQAPSKLATTNAPVLEDTSMGDAVKVTAAGLDDSVSWCDRDGVLDSGETGLLLLTARNLGLSATSAPQTLQVRALSQGVTVEGAGLISFPPGAPFSVVRASTPVRLERATDVRMLEFQLDTVGQQPATSTIVSVLANADVIASTTEDFEGQVALDRGTGWRRGEELEADNYLVEQLWNISPQTPTQTVINGPNAAAQGRSWLVTPALTVGASPLTIRFRHRYQFEASGTTSWDGAYLEVSEDGQRTWALVPSASLTPAYSGTISAMTTAGNPTTNPSAGSPAWVGRSNGYPNFASQLVNLGTRYANKTIHLRFVIATDRGGPTPPGWDLDDVEVIGASGTPFSQRVADRARCVNRAPVVEAGPGLTVDEGAAVTLAASVVDPDGDVVSLSWIQLSGPAVTITADRFTAPAVTQQTTLEFEVTARDASHETKDRLTVTVMPVNTPPRVMVGAPSIVRSGQTFTITATTSDDDGDPLETTFVQTRGPLAKDLGGGRFQAPPVREPDRLYFEVAVSDGQSSATALIELGLEPSACGCAGSPADAVGFLSALLLLARMRRRAPSGQDGAIG